MHIVGTFTHAHTQECDTGSTIHPLVGQTMGSRGLLKLEERGQDNMVVGSEGMCFLSKLELQ